MKYFDQLKKLFGVNRFEHMNPIMVNSIPKSGTNLLKNIILSIPHSVYAGDFSYASELASPEDQLKYVLRNIKSLKAGDVYSGHVPYSPLMSDWFKNNKFKQLFIFRDPRDYAVSLYHYIMRKAEPRHAYYSLLNDLGDDSTRLMASINGVGVPVPGKNSSPSYIPSVNFVFQNNHGWLSDENTFCLSYEEMIDPSRGPELIKRMLIFLEFKPHEINTDFRTIYEKGIDPKKSRTYRKGKAGTWKEEFTDAHVAAFKNIGQDIMQKYGYTW